MKNGFVKGRTVIGGQPELWVIREAEISLVAIYTLIQLQIMSFIPLGERTINLLQNVMHYPSICGVSNEQNFTTFETRPDVVVV